MGQVLFLSLSFPFCEMQRRTKLLLGRSWGQQIHNGVFVHMQPGCWLQPRTGTEPTIASVAAKLGGWFRCTHAHVVPAFLTTAFSLFAGCF